MIKLAVDLMGSDMGPVELIKGLKEFLSEHKDCEVVAFGDIKTLTEQLGNTPRVTIKASEEVVPMEINPFGFLRLKKSSMYLAIQMAANDPSIDGVVSAGSTGGFVIGSTLMIKNAPGVRRAGLAAPFVTAVKGKKTIILDIGANNKNTGDELVCFAKMGAVYAREVLGEKEPKTYLLSNGAEEGKGLDECVDAYAKLKGFPGFMGNCESRDALDGTKDVIVTTGYPGNIMLKAFEGTAQLMMGLMKKAFTKNWKTKIGYLLAKSGLKEMKETLDYRSTGGAILLGIKKVAVKAHGNSNAYAFKNGLSVAYSMAEAHIVDAISRELAK